MLLDVEPSQFYHLGDTNQWNNRLIGKKAPQLGDLLDARMRGMLGDYL